MKNFIITAMLLSMVSLLSAQQQPSRDVDITDEGVIVTYRFPAAIHTQDRLYPEAQSWLIQGFGTNHNAGQPAYPFHWDTFAVPEGTTPSVDLIAGEYADTAFVLAPAYPLLSMSDSREMTRDIVPPITSYTGFYPQQTLAMSNIQYYRGQGMVRVCTMPVQYDCEHHVIRSYSSLTYKISFTDNTGRKQKGLVTKSASSKISKTDHFMQNVTLNYSDETHDLAAEEQEDPARAVTNTSVEDERRYLIITVPAFDNAVWEFAEWKKVQGYTVSVVCNPYNTPWTTQSVKNKIQYYYDNAIPLEHVLFVGDIDYIPSYSYLYSGIEGTLHSDLPYFLLDGSMDETPDVSYGRLPYKSTTDITAALNKIIEYERNPTTNTNFYNNVTSVSLFEVSSSCHDTEIGINTFSAEEIRNYLMTYQQKNHIRIYNTQKGGIVPDTTVHPLKWASYLINDNYYIPTDLQKPNYQWLGNNLSIKNAMESGTFLMTAMLHDDSTSVEHPWRCPNFNSSDIANLNNPHLYPVIFSSACSSGCYSANDACFSEKLVAKDGGGAVGIISPNDPAAISSSEVLIESFVKCIWPGFTPLALQLAPNSMIPEYKLGKVMNQGKALCDNYYNSGDIISDPEDVMSCLKKNFYYLGDPAMELYTATPQTFSHPIFNFNNGKITVQTNENDVRISIYAFMDNEVKSYIGNYAEYTPDPDTEWVKVCLQKHNYLPYIIIWKSYPRIQNKTITDKRGYVGDNILIGTNVASWEDPGDVLFNGADVKIKGTSVEIQPNTTITNSNVIITTSN